MAWAVSLISFGLKTFDRSVLAETGRLFLYLKVNNQTSDAPLMLLSARRPYPKALKVLTGTRKGVAV